MTKPFAKNIAITLRREGHSYNYIARKTGVSKGTLAVWLAEVPYTPNAETIARIGVARAASGKAKSAIKRASILTAKAEAGREIRALSQRDLFMAGLGLYIGEGAKSTTSIRFVNSNPAVMNFMIRWFIEAIGVEKKHLRLRLHLYPDSDEAESVRFWSKTTGIPSAQFHTTQFDWRKDKKSVKFGKLPHGTAHLSIHSLGEKRFGVFLARKILGWSDVVLETDSFAGLV